LCICVSARPWVSSEAALGSGGGPFKAVTAHRTDDCGDVLARPPSARAFFVRMRLTHKSAPGGGGPPRRPDPSVRAVVRQIPSTSDVVTGRLQPLFICLLQLSARRPGHLVWPMPSVRSGGRRMMAPRCLTSRARVTPRALQSTSSLFHHPHNCTAPTESPSFYS
jgi:hypothetical protein